MFSSQDSVMPALWGHEAADQHYCLPSEEFSGPAEQVREADTVVRVLKS